VSDGVCSASAQIMVAVNNVPVVTLASLINGNLELKGISLKAIDSLKNLNTNISYFSDFYSIGDTIVKFKSVSINNGDDFRVTTSGGCSTVFNVSLPITGVLEIENAYIKQGENISLYNLSGIELISLKAPKDYNNVLQIRILFMDNNLPSGIYFIRTNKSIDKFSIIR